MSSNVGSGRSAFCGALSFDVSCCKMLRGGLGFRAFSFTATSLEGGFVVSRKLWRRGLFVGNVGNVVHCCG